VRSGDRQSLRVGAKRHWARGQRRAVRRLPSGVFIRRFRRWAQMTEQGGSVLRPNLGKGRKRGNLRLFRFLRFRAGKFRNLRENVPKSQREFARVRVGEVGGTGKMQGRPFHRPRRAVMRVCSALSSEKVKGPKGTEGNAFRISEFGFRNEWQADRVDGNACRRKCRVVSTQRAPRAQRTAEHWVERQTAYRSEMHPEAAEKAACPLFPCPLFPTAQTSTQPAPAEPKAEPGRSRRPQREDRVTANDEPKSRRSASGEVRNPFSLLTSLFAGCPGRLSSHSFVLATASSLRPQACCGSVWTKMPVAGNKYCPLFSFYFPGIPQCHFGSHNP
jgi:hypothetical protein